MEGGTVGAGTVSGSHTYAPSLAGTFTVTVTVIDQLAASGSDTLDVRVLKGTKRKRKK